ncbi:1013_t:CDS:1, partial [Scutellospora calospora]
SSYVTSFRSVSDETKDIIFKLYDIRHGPNSTYHTYWEQMQLKYANDEEMLANRALFPYKNDFNYLYKKYRDKHIGTQNRINMFSQLEEEIKEFNINRKGDTWMQKFITSNQSNSEQHFILVVVTNLMKCCHELQEAGELVYIDITAGLDVLNTPLTILSTSTSAGSLPLAAILTSDETEATFIKALDMVKKIVPSVVFGRQGSIIRPQVVITDDCRAEKLALHNT